MTPDNAQNLTLDDARSVLIPFATMLSELASRTAIKFDDTLAAAFTGLINNDKLLTWVLERIGLGEEIPGGVFSVQTMPEEIKAEFRLAAIGDGLRDRLIEMILPVLIEMFKKWLRGQGIPVPSTEESGS